MASGRQQKALFREDSVPPGQYFKIALVVSEWNAEITDALCTGCMQKLLHHGVQEENVTTVYVPGSFELPQAAQLLLETAEFDVVICLGCIIQGETKHDEYLASAVSAGIMMVSLDYSTPVVFGVLTTRDMAQAKERAGGKSGHKGEEAAITALKMAALRQHLI